MKVAQRSINFGSCEPSQQSQKYIVLHNASAAPLLYRVVKTGRHASFDLSIQKEDRTGCVRPFGAKQIRFRFRPSLTVSSHRISWELAHPSHLNHNFPDLADLTDPEDLP